MSVHHNLILNILFLETRDDKLKDWDVLQEGTTDDEVLSCAGCYEFSKKLLKVIFIIVTFLMTFCSIIISKMSIILVTSNLVNTDKVEHFTKVTTDSCGVTSNRSLSGTRCGVPLCPSHFVYHDGPLLGVRWMWTLCMCISTPYVLVLLRCIRQMLFKKKDNPKLWPTLTVSIVSKILFFV